MKKSFISFAFAAALACGASAQTTATVPAWYSYQGVCADKSADITVEFHVVDIAEQSTVYAEKHSVSTNASGTFNCKLGLGKPVAVGNHSTVDFADVDWAAGNYQVETYINDALVATADLGSVPYATVAEKAIGIDGVDNIAATLEELWMGLEQKDEFLTQAINAQALVDEEQNQMIEGLFEMNDTQALGFTQLSNIVNDLSTEVELNAAGLAEAEKSILEISEEMPGIVGTINKLLADNEINIDGIAEAEKAILEISEEIPGIQGAINKLLEDNEINIEGIANAEKAILEISEEIPGIKGGIEALKADVEAIYEGLGITQDDVTNLTEGVKEHETAIKNLTQQMEGAYEQLESIATLATGASNIAIANEEAIEALTQQMEGAYEQLESIATLATGASNIAIANEEAIEALKDQATYAVEQADNANLALTQLNNVVNDLASEVEINITGLNEVESALTELSPAVKGNTAAIAALQAAVEELQAKINN